MEKIGKITELPHEELRSAKSGETFARSAVLTDYLGFKDVFVHHEIIPPGRRTSSPHAHSSQEEMIVVLEGRPTVHVGNKNTQLSPGDFIGFEPGADQLHFIENSTTADSRVLVIASKPNDDQVSYSAPTEKSAAAPTITPMKREDAPAVAELTRQLGYPSTVQEIEHRLTRIQAEPGNHLLVARMPDGTPCGWIHLCTELSLGSEPRIEVAGLVVDEKMRGKGIGAKLMLEAERWARKNNLARIRLRSNISRTEAHRFYGRLGYEAKKTSHVFVKDLR